MQIDESTGLPALPDDMFWRIESEDLFGNTVYSMMLMKKVPEKVFVPPKYLWDAFLIRSGYYETKLGKREVRCCNLYTKHVEEDLSVVKEGYILLKEIPYSPKESHYFILYKQEPSNEVFVKTAKLLWKEHLASDHEKALVMNDELDRKKAASKFTGDYPPRKLENE